MSEKQHEGNGKETFLISMYFRLFDVRLKEYRV